MSRKYLPFWIVGILWLLLSLGGGVSLPGSAWIREKWQEAKKAAAKYGKKSLLLLVAALALAFAGPFGIPFALSFAVVAGGGVLLFVGEGGEGGEEDNRMKIKTKSGVLLTP